MSEMIFNHGSPEKEMIVISQEVEISRTNLESVTFDQIESYLSQNKWSVGKKESPYGQMWISPDKSLEVFAPTTSNQRNYLRRMTELILDIGRYSNELASNVLKDILNQSTS